MKRELSSQALGRDASTPAISVVVPTYRRPALLSRCLLALCRQQQLSAVRYEVLIVDDGHDDETREVVERVARDHAAAHEQFVIRYLRPAAGRGPSVARNAGWRAARGEVIAFTDDDTQPADDWLAEGMQAMQAQPEVAALAGRVVVPVEGPPTDHARMTQGLATAEFVTANAFVRRAALERIGGFDERFTRAWREDSDLQFRLMQEAGPVGRCDSACVEHPVREAPWGLSLQQQRNTYYDALLYKKHPQLYRERILPNPPWNYYAIVALTLLAAALALGGLNRVAAACAVVAVLLMLRFAWQRLRDTSRSASHVVEMLVTSTLIPFLSLYWRLRGALRFRVLFL
jgi:glycosyltransferase involved in cell wall biosynthesis